MRDFKLYMKKRKESRNEERNTRKRRKIIKQGKESVGRKKKQRTEIAYERQKEEGRKSTYEEK